MELKIVGVYDKGDHNKERVILEAVQDTDAKHFIISDNTYYQDGTVSNEVRHAYWIPACPVKTGDWIIIFTKDGKVSHEKQTDKTTWHFFFRKLGRTIWNQQGDCAVLFKIAEANHKVV